MAARMAGKWPQSRGRNPPLRLMLYAVETEHLSSKSITISSKADLSLPAAENALSRNSHGVAGNALSRHTSPSSVRDGIAFSPTGPPQITHLFSIFSSANPIIMQAQASCQDKSENSSIQISLASSQSPESFVYAGACRWVLTLQPERSHNDLLRGRIFLHALAMRGRMSCHPVRPFKFMPSKKPVPPAPRTCVRCQRQYIPRCAQRADLQMYCGPRCRIAAQKGSLVSPRQK